MKIKDQNRIMPARNLFFCDLYSYFPKIMALLRLFYFKVSRKSKAPERGLSVGLAGCGNFARYAYMPAFNRKGAPVVISGLFSNKHHSSEIIRKMLRYKTKIYNSYEELLGSGIKGIILTLPNHLHYECTIKALESGLDVFCEKPVTNKLKDAVSLGRYLSDKRNILMVGFNQRYTDRIEKVKSLIESKELGEIYEVNAFHNQNIADYLRKSNWLNDSNKSGGGILYNAGIHLVNLMLYFFGPIDNILAKLEYRKLPEAFGEDTVDCEFNFKSGIKGRLAASYINEVDSSYEHLVIKGSKGQAYTDLKTSSIMHKSVHDLRWMSVNCKKEFIADSVYNELFYFCDCVEKRLKPNTDIFDSIDTLSVIEAAYRSYSEKRSVCVGS